MEALVHKHAPLLKIQMLGELSVTISGTDITPYLRQCSKLMRAFCYLVVMNGKSVLPEDLINEVLNDKEYDNPARVMQNLVYRLRKFLNPDGTDGYIRTLGRYYFWDTKGDYSFDVSLFKACADNALMTFKNGIIDIFSLEKSVRLYTDNFMPDLPYDNWTISIRETLKNKYLSCVQNLLRAYKTDKNYNAIFELCESVFEKEPYCEAVHIHYLEALGAVKRLGTATQHYCQFIEPMYRALGIQTPFELKDTISKIQIKAPKKYPVYGQSINKRWHML